MILLGVVLQRHVIPGTDIFSLTRTAKKNKGEILIPAIFVHISFLKILLKKGESCRPINKVRCNITDVHLSGLIHQ